jgi:hypothetical protein
LHRDGYHGFAKKYDRRGQLSEEANFGIDRKPVLDTNGIAKATFGYDDRGNRTEQANFGLDGKPAPSKDGVHKIQTRYDERGNLLEKVYLGTDGKPVCHRRLGYARVVPTWDLARRQQTDVTYYDEKIHPVQTEVVTLEVLAGSQAARVGLRPGDVLLGYDGAEFRNTVTFNLAVVCRAAVKKPGPIPLVVRRGDRTLRFSLAPGRLGVVFEDRVPPG